jgi:hypothetical protein
VLGAIFSNRLSDGLARGLPAGASARGATVDPAGLKALPAPVHDAYISAFTEALQTVFLVATCVVLVAFALSWLIPERPLRTSVTTTVGDALGAPVDTDSLREITRALSRLVGRERTLDFLQDTVRRAGVALTPSASWLLLRAGAPDAPALTELRALPRVDPARFDAARAELAAAGLLDDAGAPTPAGHAMRDQLVAARTDGLRALVADWDPDEHAELAPLLRRLAEELAEPPAQAAAA